MLIGPAPLCMFCRHYHAGDWDKHSCEAFPEGIPEAIIYNERDHRRPYSGDRGIRFAPATAKGIEYAREMFGTEGDDG